MNIVKEYLIEAIFTGLFTPQRKTIENVFEWIAERIGHFAEVYYENMERDFPNDSPVIDCRASIHQITTDDDKIGGFVDEWASFDFHLKFELERGWVIFTSHDDSHFYENAAEIILKNTTEAFPVFKFDHNWLEYATLNLDEAITLIGDLVDYLDDSEFNIDTMKF